MTRSASCSPVRARPALARRGLTGPLPRPARGCRSRRRPAALAAVAAALGTGLVVPAPAAAAASLLPADLGLRAVALAAEEAGDPYVFGAAGPDAFDCSGLVQHVYARLGVPLPRTSRAQSEALAPVSRADVRPGDVLFFRNSAGVVDHNAIYAGDGRMWAAPRSGRTVQLQAVYGTTWTAGRPPAPPELLRVGSRGPAVAEVQRALGLVADGVFGPRTAAAVVAFQERRGLTADGTVGPATRRALLEAPAVSSPAASRGAPPARPAVPAGRPVLRQGSRGADVRALQAALGLPADGVFGPRTAAAVVEHQRRHGLAPDGVVGPRTWATLQR